MKKQITSIILAALTLIGATFTSSLAKAPEDDTPYEIVSLLSEAPNTSMRLGDRLEMSVVKGDYTIVDGVGEHKTGWVIPRGFTSVSSLKETRIYEYVVVLRQNSHYDKFTYVNFLVNGDVCSDAFVVTDGDDRYVIVTFAVVMRDVRPTYYSDGWFYTNNDSGDGIAVCGCDDADSTVIRVPETIDGKTVTGIASDPFLALIWAETVCVPATVRSLSSTAFYNLSSLSEIVVDGGNPYYASLDGVIYTKNMDTLVFIPYAKSGDVVIPEGVVEIESYATLRNAFLTELSFPSTVKIIPDHCFMYMASLTKVTFSSGIETIDTGAFWGCSSITDVYFHGTRREWSKILIEAGNEYIRNAALHCDNPFVDVPEGEWYTAAAIYCAANGYINPTASNCFFPQSSVDRRMFITVLARLDGADTEGYDSMSFGDVSVDSAYSGAAEWALQNGYTAGVGTGKDGKPRFGGEMRLTREQIAQFLYNYAQKNGRDLSADADLSQFNDGSDVSQWALGAIKWAVTSGMIDGTDSGSIVPKKICSRAEVAVIAMRFMENVMKES